MELTDEKQASLKLKDGVLFSMELKNTTVKTIVPHKVKWKGIIDFVKSAKTKSIKCDDIIIQYRPYMDNLSGSIIINVYDTRSENPRARLRLHTSFPANSDQFIQINPNVAQGTKETSDILAVEILPLSLDVTEKTNFAHIQAKCKFICHSKKMSGGTPSLKGVPALNYTRGDLLSADQLATLTRKQSFVGPPLVDGRSYVIKGIGANCQVITGTTLEANEDPKYKTRDMYESSSEVIV
ncbi:TPA_asm: P3 [Glycyrrhiza betacytorhabdovirus 1]|nr:TPA_asm: P3 [Glycyrrhiza betacytorhabdovirus 1]